MDDSNSFFFSPYKILPIAQENKYLMIFFLFYRGIVCWMYSLESPYRKKNTPKLSPFASWLGTIINTQWLESSMSRIIFYGPKDVRAFEVRLYLSGTVCILDQLRRINTRVRGGGGGGGGWGGGGGAVSSVKISLPPSEKSVYSKKKNLLPKPVSFLLDRFSERGWLVGKETESHKSCLLFHKPANI